MNIHSGNRFLAIYSGILTVAFAVTVFGGFTQSTKKTTFDEIEVHRIDVVEPDGTLRLVISNKAQFPGIIIKGKERPHPNRQTGGMLFFNDEGTENGGMIWGGAKDANGQVSSYGHLSFDRYLQDQVFTVDASEEGAHKQSRLSIVDDPDYPITDLLDEQQRVSKLPKDQQQAEFKKFFDEHGRPEQRLFLGRADDRSVALRLKDTQGRDRIVIKVDPTGNPSLQFLDENGKATAQLPSR